MATQRDLDAFVRGHVHACISALILTLATGAHAVARDTDTGCALSDLAEQAAELCYPVEDWEEAARQAGYEIRHDMHGFYACTAAEAAQEDADNPSAGFDGRPHYNTIERGARDLCEAEGIDPYEWEVYEHWIVDPWFAEKLEAHGERVDRDFAGLCIWGRTTTGQAIAADAIIAKIYDELHATV